MTVSSNEGFGVVSFHIVCSRRLSSKVSSDKTVVITAKLATLNGFIVVGCRY